MRRLGIWIAMAVVAAGIEPGLAQEDPAEPLVREMVTYQLVLLREAALEEPLNAERTSRLKTAHDHWVRNLMSYEVALAAGPVEEVQGGASDTAARARTRDEESPLKQVAIMGMASTGEAASAFQGSSSIELGVLDLEVYSLWAAGDAFARPRDLDKTELLTLGLLRRPPNAPSYPEEQLERIQEGHLANIRRMGEEGGLILAGPVENAADLRGILVFRATDQRRIREEFAQDPAMQAGRLELELYRWKTARGAFALR